MFFVQRVNVIETTQGGFARLWRLRGSRPGVAAKLLTLLLVAACNTSGLTWPLQPEEVREAYSLGHSGDSAKITRFLSQYVRHFSMPPEGAYVESVEFRTPYEQVVLRCHEHLSNYDAQQAQQDYAVNGDSVTVRVSIFSTQTYPTLATRPSDPSGIWAPEDFLRGFQYRVKQQHAIEPKKVIEQPKCPNFGRCPSPGGCDVLMEFDAAQFAVGTVQVVVTTPEGREIKSEFNLDSLK
jgi:hypothetical protein